MSGITRLRDLAVVMIVADAVTILFHRLRQPVILGYILAGVMIGPYTPPFPLVRDIKNIETLANFGIGILMFSVGLESTSASCARWASPRAWRRFLVRC